MPSKDGRALKVAFSKEVRPTEAEYINELNLRNGMSAWMFLMLILRTVVATAVGFNLKAYNILSLNIGICNIPQLRVRGWSFREIQNLTYARRECAYFDFQYVNDTLNQYAKSNEVRHLQKSVPMKYCSQKELIWYKGSFFSSFYGDLNVYCRKDEIEQVFADITDGAFAVGSILFGVIGDLFGRRRTSLILIPFWTLLSLLISIANSLLQVQILYGLLVMISYGVELLSFICLMEICNRSVRIFVVLTRYGNILGFTLCAFLNFVQYWRYVQCIESLMTLFVLFAVWYMPESPRFLLTKLKHEKALEVIQEITNLPPDIIFEGHGVEKHSICEIFRDMFVWLYLRRKAVVTYFCIIKICETAIATISILGLTINDDPVFIEKTILLRTTAGVLSMLLFIMNVSAFGKKFVIFWEACLLMVLAFLGTCLKNKPQATIHFKELFIIHTSVIRAAIDYYLPDNLPTFIRATTLGIVMAMQGLTEYLMNKYVDWKVIGQMTAFALFLVLSCIMLIVLQLPDTTHYDFPVLKLYKT